MFPWSNHSTSFLLVRDCCGPDQSSIGFFGLPPGLYYYRLNRGEIPHIRIAGQVRIPRDVVRALIASQLQLSNTTIVEGEQEPSKEE